MIGSSAVLILALVSLAIFLPAGRSTAPPFPFVKGEPVFHDFVVENGERQEAWAYTFPSSEGYKPVADEYKRELVGKGYTAMWVNDKLLLTTPSYNLVSISNGRSSANMGDADGSKEWVTVRVNLARPATILDQMSYWIRKARGFIVRGSGS